MNWLPELTWPLALSLTLFVWCAVGGVKLTQWLATPQIEPVEIMVTLPKPPSRGEGPIYITGPIVTTVDNYDYSSAQPITARSLISDEQKVYEVAQSFATEGSALHPGRAVAHVYWLGNAFAVDYGEGNGLGFYHTYESGKSQIHEITPSIRREILTNWRKIK